MRSYVNDLRLFSRDARLYLLAVAIFSFGQALPSVYAALYFNALGFDRAFIGIASTAVLLGGAVLLPAAMWVLDRVGRKRAMLLGLAMNWSFWSAAICATRGELILVLLVVSGFGNVLYGLTVVPLLAEASTPRERTMLFATYEALITLSLFFGSLVAGVVPALVVLLMGFVSGSAEVYRVALLASFIFRVMGLLPLMRLSHRRVQDDLDDFNKPRTSIEIDAPSSANAKVLHFLNPRNLLKLRTPVLLFAIPYALIAFASALILPFLPLFLRTEFGATDADISTTLGVANLAIGVLSAALPVLVRRFGRVWVVAGGCALAAAFALGIVSANTLWVVALFIILRAGLALSIVPVYRAFAIDHAPVAEYTIVSLLLQLSANIGPAIAPPLSGLAQQWVGFLPVVTACAALFFVSALLFVWVMKRVERPHGSGRLERIDA